MKDESCIFLNPLQRDGKSQRQRLVAALDPSYVSVDERDLPDLLLYAHRYSSLLRFYSATNNSAGNWREFIEHDISTLVALISDTDPEADRRAFAAGLASFSGAAIKSDVYVALFDHVVTLARRIDTWRRGSIAGLALRSGIDRLIQSGLAVTLSGLISSALRARNVGLGVPEISAASFDDAWGLGVISEDTTLFPDGAPDDAGFGAALDDLTAVFDRFHEAVVFLVANAPTYFVETIESYSSHQPHMALLLAFLELLAVAREHLNELTGKHRDFYYREVLRLAPKPAVADQVHLVFELAKRLPPHLVAKDTPLKAGKDATSAPVFFGTDEELSVYPSVLHAKHGLKTVFVARSESGDIENVHAAPDADSADGRGAPVEDEDGKWQTFGSAAMPHATLGFALSSPMFMLAEGSRNVTLSFYLRVPLPAHRDLGIMEEELRHNIDVHASGEKDWVPVAIDSVTVSNSAASPHISFSLSIDASAPPIVPFDPSILDGGFDTRAPVLRFVFDNDGLPGDVMTPSMRSKADVPEYSDEAPYTLGDLVRHEDRIYRALGTSEERGLRPERADLWQPVGSGYPYRYFLEFELGRLQIDVTVQGVRSLVMESDVGSLNPAKPFHPFGPIPRAESSFLIGSHEVFQKRLTSLDLDVVWADLPGENFSTHYSFYTPAIAGNDAFSARFEILVDGAWTPLPSASHPLFEPSGAVSEPLADRSFSFNAPSGGKALIERDPDLEPFEQFDTDLRRGFIRAVLETGFLHSVYPRVLAQKAAAPELAQIPKPPYTPLMASLSLDYTSTELIDYEGASPADFGTRAERIFQIWPFGQREIFPIDDHPSAEGVHVERRLAPSFDVTVRDSQGLARSEPAEGTLYVGLESVNPPQSIALLFQVAEGSEDPDQSVQEVVWSYLTDDDWVDFKTTEILAERTNGLLASGIVRLDLPKTLTKLNTTLPVGLRWLKASVRAHVTAVAKLIAIHPQAVTASFRDAGNDPDRLRTPLPAGRISKLKSRAAAIKSVSQPYASFSGHAKEKDNDFAIRVSEHLRHKGRAITIFDYERIVLQAFPEVYKVKCVNHTNRSSDYAPGSVRLVVVPDLRNKNAVDPLRPRLSLNVLERIREHIEEVASDFASIEVTNPQYEQIHVRFRLRLRAGRDKGVYSKIINDDIVRFLSPWLHDNVSDLTFGGRVHRSWILNYVEQREYVDFVTDFELDHILPDGSRRSNVEQAVATSSSAALVSAAEHSIEHITATCDDEADGAPPAAESEAPPQLPRGALRYLGNTRSRELHDLANLTPYCQIEEIARDRRYFFRTIGEASDLGYDFCAYCFGPHLSQR